MKYRFVVRSRRPESALWLGAPTAVWAYTPLAWSQAESDLFADVEWKRKGSFDFGTRVARQLMLLRALLPIFSEALVRLPVRVRTHGWKIPQHFYRNIGLRRWPWDGSVCLESRGSACITEFFTSIRSFVLFPPLPPWSSCEDDSFSWVTYFTKILVFLSAPLFNYSGQKQTNKQKELENEYSRLLQDGYRTSKTATVVHTCPHYSVQRKLQTYSKQDISK